MRMSSTEKNANCIFCNPHDGRVVLSNEHGYLRFDSYPVNEGHMLIVPHRHFDSYFDCTADERKSLWLLVEDGKRLVDGKHQPDGYNIGINVGPAAGQSVMHLHIHLIPRYRGDMENPKGGVRGVIPEKQKY